MDFGRGPIITAGDFNVTSIRISALDRFINIKGLFDVGARTYFFGDVPECPIYIYIYIYIYIDPSAKTTIRRDCVINCSLIGHRNFQFQMIDAPLFLTYDESVIICTIPTGSFVVLSTCERPT